MSEPDPFPRYMPAHKIDTFWTYSVHGKVTQERVPAGIVAVLPPFGIIEDYDVAVYNVA